MDQVSDTVLQNKSSNCPFTYFYLNGENEHRKTQMLVDYTSYICI